MVKVPLKPAGVMPEIVTVWPTVKPPGGAAEGVMVATFDAQLAAVMVAVGATLKLAAPRVPPGLSYRWVVLWSIGPLKRTRIPLGAAVTAAAGRSARLVPLTVRVKVWVALAPMPLLAVMVILKVPNT